MFPIEDDKRMQYDMAVIGVFRFVCVLGFRSIRQSGSRDGGSRRGASSPADIAIMEIVGGSPLSATEKQQIVTAAAHGLATDQKGWIAGYQNAQKALSGLTQGTPLARAEEQEYWRLNFANQAQPNAETQIMERHDPKNYLRSALDSKTAFNLKAASGAGPIALTALMDQQYYNVTQADTRLIELVALSPLSDTEKRQIAEYTAEGLSTRPELFEKNYPRDQQTLQALTGQDPYVTGKDPGKGTNTYIRESTRENWRLIFAQQPDTDVEKQIAERHDPLIAARFGENHLPTDIVTETSLHAIADTVVWANARAGLPAPPSGLIATERRLIKQNWASYSPELQTAYAHIGRNVSASSINMSDIEPAKVKNFIQISLNSKIADSNKITAGNGPGALPALMVQAYYNYLIKNGHTLGMSTQEEIMWTHMINGLIYKTHRDTIDTMLGERTY